VDLPSRRRTLSLTFPTMARVLRVAMGGFKCLEVEEAWATKRRPSLSRPEETNSRAFLPRSSLPLLLTPLTAYPCWWFEAASPETG